MIKIIILMACAMQFGTLSAQTIQGKITDSHQQPLSYANLILLNLTDSSFIQGTVSQEDGSFRLNISTEQNYIMKASCIGYQTVFKESNGFTGTIVLPEDTHQLAEVEVKGNLPSYQLKGDRLTTHVQGSLLSKLGTANQVLERIPGIEGRKGEFTVFGKGTPLIYINGRKVYDRSELEKISSEDIHSVDLIHNPGAEYDANIKAVLNIQLVRKQGDRLGLQASSQFTQAHRSSHDQQLQLNYHHKQLDFFTHFSFQQQKNWQKQLNNQTIQSDTLWNIQNQLHLESDIKSCYTSTGFNYEWNEKHSFGFIYTGNFGLKGEGGWNSEMDIKANGNDDDRIQNSFIALYQPNPNHSINGYCQGNIGKLKIDWNMDYINNRNQTDQQSVEISQNKDDRTVTTLYKVNNQLTALKLILSHPLSIGTISGGTEMSWTRHEDRYINPEHILPDTENKLQEDHSAAFFSYRIDLHNWQLNAGLRYEHIRNRYYINEAFSEEQSRTYNHFFPNISVSKAFGSLQTSLSYTAKTIRPSYRSLSSNRQYNDRFTYQGGNPYLQPTQGHDITLNMNYKWLYFNASYQINRNAIYSAIEPYEDDPLLCIWIPRNIEKKQNLWVMLNASPHIGCWHPSFSVSLVCQFMDIKTTNPLQKPYQPRLYAGINNLFNLPWHITLNVDGMCKSNTYEGKTWRPGYGSFHIGLSKSFLKNGALSLQIQAFDLLKAFRNSAKNYTDTITFETWNYSDSRSLTLTIRYKFNSTTNKYKGCGAGNAEKNRL